MSTPGCRHIRAYGAGTRKVLWYRELLQCLTMLRNVEAFQLVFAGYAQGDESANQLEKQEGHAPGPDQGHRHAIELDQQLSRIAFQQSRRSADCGGGEDAGE